MDEWVSDECWMEETSGSESGRVAMEKRISAEWNRGKDKEKRRECERRKGKESEQKSRGTVSCTNPVASMIFSFLLG